MYPPHWICPSSEGSAIKLYDISRELLSAPVYEGDALPALNSVSVNESGTGFFVSSLLASLHAGTHCDAPLHCINEGADIASMPLSCYIGHCRLMALEGGIVKKPDLVRLEGHSACERLIIKGNARLNLDAAQYIIERGVKTIGTDAISIAEPSNELEIHRLLLGANIAVIEQLYLEDVKEGEYFLFAPPIKIKGAEGSFCRAVLIEGFPQI